MSHTRYCPNKDACGIHNNGSIHCEYPCDGGIINDVSRTKLVDLLVRIDNLSLFAYVSRRGDNFIAKILGLEFEGYQASHSNNYRLKIFASDVKIWDEDWMQDIPDELRGRCLDAILEMANDYYSYKSLIKELTDASCRREDIFKARDRAKALAGVSKIPVQLTRRGVIHLKKNRSCQDSRSMPITLAGVEATFIPTCDLDSVGGFVYDQTKFEDDLAAVANRLDHAVHTCEDLSRSILHQLAKRLRGDARIIVDVRPQGGKAILRSELACKVDDSTM